MFRSFPFFVALRYLTARRKQTVLSIVTVISVAGVAAGVMALVLAMAITNGYRTALQTKLIGATAHVWVMEKEVSSGIPNWREVSEKVKSIPHVRHVSPSLYDGVMFNGPIQATPGVLKGILSPDRAAVPDALRHLKAGRFESWDLARGHQPIILGSNLADQLGVKVEDTVGVISRYGDQTPFGPKYTQHRFRVIGIFETGLFDLDSSWAYTSMKAVQDILGLQDVANAVEMTLDDPDRSDAVAKEAEKLVGPKLGASDWKQHNRRLLSALQGERMVAMITIGLILLMAVLNILTSLTMMVMEKHRDIAILISMGARQPVISRIFVLQGILIGIAGTGIGLITGHILCFVAERYQLLRLDQAVYSLNYVPVLPRLSDSVWISLVAIAVSFLATLYPARGATRIAPAEALRFQ
ncbi:MAG: ABC transporter permease [Bryobacteraceae bacterium]